MDEKHSSQNEIKQQLSQDAALQIARSINKPKRRQPREKKKRTFLGYARLVFILLAVEGFLLFLNWVHWIPKGWAALIAIVFVGVVMLLIFLGYVFALILRWQFQFSIRSLLALTVAFAIPFSWLAIEMKWANEQKRAIENVIRLGGNVNYEYEIDEEYIGFPLVNPQAIPPYSTWLRNLLGDDYFFVVSQCVLGEGVTDKDLENLKLLNQIKHLALWNLQITDAGLESIESLSQLQSLRLSGHAFTDGGIEHFIKLKQLKGIHFHDTSITDAGLARLKELEELQTFNLNSTLITDAGLESLGKMTQLKRVYLSDIEITDAGMAHLEGLTQLITLNVQSPKITDGGLEYLKGMSQLHTLYIPDAQVTNAGIKKLHDSLPKANIINFSHR